MSFGNGCPQKFAAEVLGIDDQFARDNAIFEDVLVVVHIVQKEV